MTEEEKFIFDLEGYLIIKNILTANEVDEMNQMIEDGDRSGPPSTWGEPFKNLIDHAKILPYLLELIGPYVRIDHDYAMFMQSGISTGGRLHGGEDGGRPGGPEGDHWYKYRDGIIRNGLCVVTYNLAPAKVGDGGFACVPGSHKSNYLTNFPDDVRWFERRPHYVKQPAVDAGDVTFFTESLIHGTMSWKGQQERRALFYKYSPGHSAWSDQYYDADQYSNLTDRQRLMMRPPSIGTGGGINRPCVTLDEN
ncbi:hypothetical protein CMK18_05420 [Candidatus Poribacteria bacterium]|nr:hypothetical protein [Candidatus Poribacteria bacterium]